jgi:hypothetical protein
MLEINVRVLPFEPEDKPDLPSKPETPNPDSLDEEQSKKMVDEGCPNLLPDE